MLLRALKIIGGVTVSLSGIILFVFGCNLFMQQQTWLMAGALLISLAIGLGLLNLGIAIIRGGSIKNGLAYLFFIGRRAP